jgi:hypothetical protein
MPSVLGHNHSATPSDGQKACPKRAPLPSPIVLPVTHLWYNRLSRSKFQTSEVLEGDIGSKIALIMPVFIGKGALERPPRSCYRNILDLLRLKNPTTSGP